MKQWLGRAVLSFALILSGCGGGGGGGGGSSAPVSGGGTTTPTAGGCALRARQDWAAAQIREWYLFPETLPTTLDPSPYTSVDAYIDALTATARAQRRDRYFTYLTSIAEDAAFFASGSSAGFGFRLSYDMPARRLFVSESFEGAPALAAGIDRGTEILKIGQTVTSLQSVADIIAAQGVGALAAALGSGPAGTTLVLQVSDAAGTRTLTVARADYSIIPVSSRYGTRIIDDGGRKIGYVNLRTFISTADPALRQSFAEFRAQGITQIIVDLRYNGGGLVSIAELMGDLLGGNRTTQDVLSYTTFRPEKASNNTTRTFKPQAQSVSPTRIAFIGTFNSASASELVINAFIPYLHANAGLIGTNTYGKPVGQIAIDRTECDDRLRLIAFKTDNAAHQGDYYDGLAAKMEATCQAADDLSRPLGDPQEASTRAALDYLAGRSCTPIGAAPIASGASTQSVKPGQRALLIPDRPTTAQREVPGLF